MAEGARMVDDQQRPLVSVGKQGGSIRTFLGFPAWMGVVGFLALMVLSVLMRLVDLKDPPLDFHETRQLGSAIIARGMYYQNNDAADPELRELAVDLWQEAPVYEPPVLERLVATAYHLMRGEVLWVVRLINAGISLLGGLGIYLLSCRFNRSGGAIVAAGFFLLTPFSLLASRSFQPDLLMVVMIIYACLALLHWTDKKTWLRASGAGLIAGLAILIKAVAVFPVAGAFAGLLLVHEGLRRVWRQSQVWLMGLLAIAPTLIYHFFFIPERAEGLFGFWVSSFRDLVMKPSFYIGWAQQIHRVVGLEVFGLAIVGILSMRSRRGNGLWIGALVGYAAYALALPYQIMTHDYYHLMILIFVSIGLGAAFEPLFSRLSGRNPLFRIGTVCILAGVLGAQLWGVRVELVRKDYSFEPEGWRRIGQAIPLDGATLALTHSYGFRIGYYGWRDVDLWPYVADLHLWDLAGRDAFEPTHQFDEMIAEYDYFLVTHFGELEQQPELKAQLESYAIFAEGDGFILYDLHTPKTQDG